MPGTRVRPPAGPSVNLVPGIHVFRAATKTWLAGTSPAMTTSCDQSLRFTAEDHGGGDQGRDADEQAEEECLERAPAAAAALEARLLLEIAGRQRAVGERALALDQALRHVFRHRIDHLGDVHALGQHLAAVAAVLQEPVDALVAAHRDVGDGVDPEPRRLAAADAAIEQIDQGGALGVIDARLAQRFLEALRRLRLARLPGVPTFATPHGRQPTSRSGQGNPRESGDPEITQRSNVARMSVSEIRGLAVR